MLKRALVAGSIIGTAGGLAALVLCCSSEDTSVDIPTSCDVTQLHSDPGETNVRLFVEASNDLSSRAKDIDAKLTSICNTINMESGLPTGTDVHSACNTIAKELGAAQGVAVAFATPEGGAAPLWVNIAYDQASCVLNTSGEGACVAQCTGTTCDLTTSCPAGQLYGACGGNCTGTCWQTGASNACTGECRGACASPDGGAFACSAAECTGKCGGATWTGTCDTGCDRGFVGKCGGTCNGTCDGQPVGMVPDGGPPPMDAGPDAAPEGGTDGGATDGSTEGGGPPDAGDAGGPPPAPGGADGNCPSPTPDKGVCIGTCSSKASGTCTAKCRGGFQAGQCAMGCSGSCSTAALGCTTSCDGTCVSGVDAGSCSGACFGSCSTMMADAGCKTHLKCMGNALCTNVCAVKSALATTCSPPLAIEVRVAGDLVVYQSLKKHVPELAEVFLEAKLLNNESFKIANVTLDDYKAIGVTRDRARLCILAAAGTTLDARTSLAKSLGAIQILSGTQF